MTEHSNIEGLIRGALPTPWRVSGPHDFHAPIYDMRLGSPDDGATWNLFIGQARQRLQGGGSLTSALMAARKYVATTYPATWVPTKRVDRDWGEVSVSQVDDFTCKRSWWLSQMAAAPKQVKRAADFGIEVHAAVERWVKDDVWPMLHYVQKLIRALDLMDRTRLQGVELEARFKHVLPTGVTLVGSKDIIDLRLPGVLQVLDMKTHTNLDKWGVPREKIGTNLQLNLYAWHHWQMLTALGVPPEAVIIGQVQMQSGEQPTRKQVNLSAPASTVELYEIRKHLVLTTPEQMLSAVEQVTQASSEMRRIADTAVTQEDVEATVGEATCDKYTSRDNPNGCKHALYCTAWQARQAQKQAARIEREAKKAAKTK